MKGASKLFSIVILSFVISQQLSAQSFAVSRIWIHVQGGSELDSMWFGNTAINTFEVDFTAPGEFMEIEPPPVPPTFECLWVLPPGRAGQWDGIRGLLWRDWRHMDGLQETRKDTWAIQFIQYVEESATVSFRWPDPASLAAQCDSLVMIDTSGRMGWPENRLDMYVIDSLTIPAATERGITRFWIIKSGAKGTLGAHELPRVPAETQLLQNFPNPFNPSTTIAARIPSREYVTLKIYDVLGRELTTVFEGLLEPGDHEFGWNGGSHASGIYYARMIAGHSVVTQRLVLAR